jgi:hypothetical protein
MPARSVRGCGACTACPQDTSESLDARIDGEELDGQAEVVEVREAQERLQVLSLEASEEIDAYQNKHSPQER